MFTKVLMTDGLTLRKAEQLQGICNFSERLDAQYQTLKSVERVTLDISGCLLHAW